MFPRPVIGPLLRDFLPLVTAGPVAVRADALRHSFLYRQTTGFDAIRLSGHVVAGGR